MMQWIGPIVSIIFVDLALSGDNALVIGATAAVLPRKQRLYAILLGGGGAIILRILFASAATLLLQIPLIQAIGGVVIFFIAFRLLLERSQKRRHSDSNSPIHIRHADSFLLTLLAIIVADVTMSLDNILAIGAIAHGQILTLSAGLFVSIALILLGSVLVAEIISNIPFVLDIASLILAWTAGTMILNDIRLGPMLNNFPWAQIIIPLVASVMILLADLFLWRRDAHQIERQ
ncbi:MAG TPA: YjbE family putative metal transport protein [Ktedonobacteraceae bacterium]|jgi:YjbE family integral membrane protein